MSRRFDYVKYDEQSAAKQAFFKGIFCSLDEAVVSGLKPSRAQSLVLTKLEEAYLWVGKALRDEQIERDSTTPDCPERTNE